MALPTDIELENVRCPLGCLGDDELVLTGRDLLHDLPGEFSVVRCRSCGLMRTNPRPTPGCIGYYYPDDYGPYVGTRFSARGDESDLRKLLKKIRNAFIDFYTHALPELPPGDMLEIGCASGSFLHQMQKAGWRVNGVELSASAAKHAIQEGYRVHVGPLESAPDPDHAYDLIVGWMVLEHLHDPIGALRKLRAWAKDDSVLALSVPDAGSLEFRVFGNRWYALHLPAHLYHYTPESLKRVLEAGGWTMVRIYHHRVLGNLFGSLANILRDKGHVRSAQMLNSVVHGGWISYALYPLAWIMAALGQTGRITVWAKPASS